MDESESDIMRGVMLLRHDRGVEVNESEGKEIISGSGSRACLKGLYVSKEALCKDSMVDCLRGVSLLEGKEGRLDDIFCLMCGIAFLIKSLGGISAGIAEQSLSVVGE